jgi:hypothetical protein
LRWTIYYGGDSFSLQELKWSIGIDEAFGLYRGKALTELRALCDKLEGNPKMAIGNRLLGMARTAIVACRNQTHLLSKIPRDSFAETAMMTCALKQQIEQIPATFSKAIDQMQDCLIAI